MTCPQCEHCRRAEQLAQERAAADAASLAAQAPDRRMVPPFTPTPAELAALAGGDKIAASIFRHGPAVVTNEAEFHARQARAREVDIANIGSGYRVPERKLPEPERKLPRALPTCPVCCRPKKTPDALCECDTDPSWARPPT